MHAEKIIESFYLLYKVNETKEKQYFDIVLRTNYNYVLSQDDKNI